MTSHFRQRKPAVKLRAKDLALDPVALTLLRAVESGTRVFAPEENTAEGLDRFQHTVRLLRMLERRRYLAIDGLNLVTGYAGSSSQIDRVRLGGGLTEKGRAVLWHHDEQTESNQCRSA